jgi:hypothetical protein
MENYKYLFMTGLLFLILSKVDQSLWSDIWALLSIASNLCALICATFNKD